MNKAYPKEWIDTVAGTLATAAEWDSLVFTRR
jgi:hypothetical protein